MGQVSRRGFLLGTGCGVALGALSTPAAATVVRSVSLPVLVQSSRRIVVMTALASHSHYEELGRRRRIVTDTRVRIEEALAKAEGIDSELLVRTLGGKVGDVGELVHGQAQLALDEPCVAFLLQGPDGLHYVNAMSQGHYPLRGSGTRLLRASPDLPKVLGFDDSAVKALVGSELGAATARVRGLVTR
jgi:hypothetical protein